MVIRAARPCRRRRCWAITVSASTCIMARNSRALTAFFNGHYDTWCYLPVVATATFTTNPLFAPAGYGWRRCPGRRSRGRGGRRYVAAQRDAIRSGNARRMVNP
jgi:hypothetical protein